jgi:hypothetical protein
MGSKYFEPWRPRLAREFEGKEPEYAREPLIPLEIIEFRDYLSIPHVQISDLSRPLRQILVHQAPSRLIIQLSGFRVCSLDIVVFVGHFLRSSVRELTS